MLPRVFRTTITIGLSLAGVACGLTLVYLSMRAVMDVGGFCAEGGPFDIETHCPQGVPGIMVGGLLGGLVLAFVYVGVAVWRGIPSFAMLLWPALFLSLGWNFLEYAFDPPGAGGGVVWGWLICGIVFMLMGGLPLLVMLPATIRGFTRDAEAASRLARRHAARPDAASRGPGAAGDGNAGGHGGRTRAAGEAPRARVAHRRRVRGREGEAPVSAGLRFYWLVVQAAAVAGGIYAGWWLFNWATS